MFIQVLLAAMTHFKDDSQHTTQLALLMVTWYQFCRIF